MSFSLVLNSANLVGTGNNTYVYNFVKGNFTIPEGSEMIVSSCQIPYSFYNITSAYNNNQFQFSWPTGTNTYTTSTITIPDGFYTTTSLNAYLQQWCISNGYYLVNASGQNVYYYSLQYNAYQYGNQLIGAVVPTSLPGGYTQPSNFAGFPTTARTPYLTMLSNNFTTYLGFTAGNYGINQTVAYSANSNQTPVGSTVNSICIRCSLVKNNVGIPMDLLDSFPIANTSFGANINYNPQVAKWVSLNSGSFANFAITFSDQNLNLINALDSNILLTLLIRFPNKNNEK